MAWFACVAPSLASSCAASPPPAPSLAPSLAPPPAEAPASSAPPASSRTARASAGWFVPPPPSGAPEVSVPLASAAPDAPPPAPSSSVRVVSPRGTKLSTGAWLATPCVDPVLDVAARTGHHVEGMFTADETTDLDGDGADDLVVFVGATSITDTRVFYVRRGPCGHFVGRVSSSANLSFVDERAGGLRRLRGRSRCQVECCARDVIETWGFDGTSYRLQREERLPPCKPGGASSAVP